MKILKAYQIEKNLPGCDAGTIIFHEYENLPSQYRSHETYNTDGRWFCVESGLKVPIPGFLKDLVRWCSATQREEYQGWVTENETEMAQAIAQEAMELRS